MSYWTHLICEVCWSIQHPGKQAHRLHGAQPEPCCFCGHVTNSGIFVREAAAGLTCKGEKGIHVNDTN